MRLNPVPFHKVKIHSPFWSPRLNTVQEVTIPKCLDFCESTGRLANFRRAAGMESGGFEGIYFNDSDVYKILEGAAYALTNRRDPELEQRADSIISAVIAAQQPDGYINTYFTLTGQENRWTDMGLHEAYCIGHMVEGAVAWHQATGSDKWLRCAERAARHMMSVFGPGKRRWVPGHQEIELALIRLYRHTGEKDFLDFARWLVEERGHGYMRADSFSAQGFMGEYAQDAVPASEQRRVTGHAVRAMYYYSAMTDLEAEAGDGRYAAALDALWNHVIPANYYVTGGIGQSSQNEGFTRDFHKPCLTAYCETCAAIGMAMWNHRMNLLTGESRYADVVETEIYNGALAGLSLRGDRFFYENPLSSVGRHHRQAWFGCSCCPTNLARFIPSVGGYAYALAERTICVNQYVSGSIALEDESCRLSMSVKTDYPWDGKIVLNIQRCGGIDTLCLRLPGWCKKYTLSAEHRLNSRGYLTVPLQERMHIELMLDMPARRVYEDDRVAETRNRVCICRGPLVYCAEETDNPGIPPEYFPSELTLSRKEPLVLNGRDPALGNAVVLQSGNIRLIPYAFWDNRQPGAMVVWMKED